jgi:hypothetical protein
MSVATLENGNLTLGNLTINNSQYAEASGYVASQTVFSSTVNSTSLTVPSISTPTISTSNITTPLIGVVSSLGSTTFTNLTCSAGNTLSIGNGAGGNTSNGTLDVGGIVCSGIISAETAGSVSTPIVGVYNPTTTTDFINLSCPNSNILAIGNGTGVNAYNGDLLCSDIGVSGAITCATTGSIVSPSLAFYVNTTDNFVNLTGSGNVLSVGNSSGTVGASNGTVRCSSIVLSANGTTGTLSVNSTGGLTWNGVVIS